MKLLTPIPQEIIDEIVNHVDGEGRMNTLKSCAVVSRSFLSPCLKNMFSSVALTVKSARQLLPLLKQRPDITNIITDASLFIPLCLNDESKTTIPDILGLLKNLRQLTVRVSDNLGQQRCPKSGRVPHHLFESSHLTAINVERDMYLSSNMINDMGVKKLRLNGVPVKNHGTMAETELKYPSSALESLDISVISAKGQARKPLQIFRNVIGLRELAVRVEDFGHRTTLSVARRIIEKSAGSIEHIALYYDAFNYDIVPNLNLGSITNLRFLSFSINFYYSEDGQLDSCDFDWCSVLEILKDSSVTRNLQEVSLAVVIRIPDAMSWDVLESFRGWAQLDVILGSNIGLPNLRKINIYVDGGSLENGAFMGNVNNQRLRNILLARFPLIQERRVTVLSSFCYLETLDFRRW